MSPRARVGRALLPAALGAFLLAGCGDLEGYRGTFRGQVVGQSAEESFVRRGFQPDTELTLELDPTNANTRPGTLSTTTLDGAPPLFRRAPLLVLEPLAHDLLSAYDFPDGRLRNYIFAARVSDEALELPSHEAVAGRDATVFVSLMKGGAVEARIVVGTALYGLFYLVQLPEER